VDERLADAIGELRERWRLDFRVAERLLWLLRPPGATLHDLVVSAAAARREVEDVLRRLDPWLERAGERYALTEEAAGELPSVLPDRPPVDERALAATMAELAAGLPPPVWSLDHVPATAATMAARAAYLAGAYDLAGATLLCVGDHDLTSVAVTLAEPGVRALVVDVDQRLLAYLDQVAARLGLPITTAYGDLRVGLPASFAGRADLAFTDPPYTPDGVGLFVTRALEGLARTGRERVVFAYAAAGHQLGRGFRTQSVLHELRLLIEAALPRFNRFAGAEAIGAASTLYVCRPTRWTWPVVDRAEPGRADPRIYTRGSAAAEAASPPPDPAVLELVEREVAGWPPRRLVVGDGWPATVTGRRAGVVEFLDDPRPALVNLHPHLGAALPLVLLASATQQRLLVVAPRRDVRDAVDGPLRALIDAVAEVDAHVGAASGVLVLRRRAEAPRTGEGEVAAYLVTHPVAKLGNAWRDALLAVARRRELPLTRNQARAAVEASGQPATVLDIRLAELPRHRLQELVAAIPASVTRVMSGSSDAPSDLTPEKRTGAEGRRDDSDGAAP
jgi:N4-bis(aminopropyl)spermidine synthase